MTASRFVSRWVVRLSVFAVLLAGSLQLLMAAAAPPQAAAVASVNCVAIGAPKPTLNFTYRYADTSTSSDYTNRWDQFSPTGSRLITTRTGANAGQSTYVSKHQVVDDTFVLEASTSVGTDANGTFNNSMTYSPGAIGDPAYKACEGKTWKIAPVNATMKSLQGSFSVKTDPGTMTIIAIHESMTVPAGTFDTVHYMKTMNSGRGQLVDEFWKSIEHGVTVKRNSRQPGGIAVETLIAIK
jgi:hypothetical protein